jgi:hypothetical protein
MEDLLNHDLHSALPSLEMSIKLGIDVFNTLLQTSFNGFPLRFATTPELGDHQRSFLKDKQNMFYS